VLVGVSGAFGPNETGGNSRTRDLRRRSALQMESRPRGRRFSLREMADRSDVSPFRGGRGLDKTFPVAETFHDWGLYSQVVWGFEKGGPPECAATISTWRSRPSPTMTCGKVAPASRPILPGTRLSFQRSASSTITTSWRRTTFCSDRGADSLFLQFEFILGAPWGAQVLSNLRGSKGPGLSMKRNSLTKFLVRLASA
jgi:hypothetical protein